MTNVAKGGPFVLAAMDYLRAGWHPFPACHTADKSKAPCVKGVIGWDAIDVTPALLRQWAFEYRKAQLGIRLPKSVLGLDVDMYDNKTGAIRMRDLIATYGPLPHTWVSTSRTDGSGIYLFRVSDSSQFPHDLGGGIEVIRSCGRFVMAAPSWHPKTGRQYGFIRPDGVFVLDELPSVDELPSLPSRWVTGLQREARSRPSVVLEVGEARAWIAALPGGKKRPCAGMRVTFEKYTHELARAETGSRHDTALRGVHALVGDACEGHGGLWWCLVRYGKQLEEKRNGARDSEREFRAMVHSEVGRRMAEPVFCDDPCDYFGWERSA